MATVRTLGQIPFRLPTEDDPAPPTARIVLVSFWAAALTLIGAAIGARAFVGLLFTDAPGWFQPTVIAAGVVGIACTAGALASVQHRQLPWLLLPAATGAVIIAFLLTITAL